MIVLGKMRRSEKGVVYAKMMNVWMILDKQNRHILNESGMAVSSASISRENPFILLN